MANLDDFAQFEVLGGLVLSVDAEGRVRSWNRSCEQVTGLAREDAQGSCLWELGELWATRHEAARAKATIRALLSQNERETCLLSCAWGKPPAEQKAISLVGTVIEDQNGEALVLLNGVDITPHLADCESKVQRLNALLEQAPDGVFVADLEGQYTDVNEAGCRMLGYEKEELLGKRITDILFPEDRPRLWTSREKLLQGKVQVDEWYLRRADGSAVPVEVSAKILPDGRWQGLVRDIGERKRSAEELRLSEERLRVALRAAPASAWNQDRDLRYTWVHNPKEPLTVEEVLGKTDSDLLSPDDAFQIAKLKRSVLESGVGARDVVSARFGKDVYMYDLAIEPLSDAQGNTIGITCWAFDVTDQQRAEAEQRLLARLGESLMRATPDYEEALRDLAALAVGELADWFLIDLVEDAQVRRLRVTSSDPNRRALADAIERLNLDRNEPHLMYQPLQKRPLLISEMTPGKLEALSQSGEHLQLNRAMHIHSLLGVPLQARGRLLGALALVSSKKARTYREHDLRFAEDLARLVALAIDDAQLYQSLQRAILARDEVLGAVAHDLRNPLHAILLQTQLLVRKGAPERRSQKPVAAIRRAAQRMNRLIQDMLDTAHLEAGALRIQATPVPARALLAEVCETHGEAAARAGIHVHLDVPDELPEVLCDRHRLLQVFDNLIDNAIKFTAKKGHVFLGAQERASVVVFWVQDTGMGMSSEQLSHVFDRFWRAEQDDHRGVGLGLPIVKGLIELHGGRMWVESQIGVGTTFYFTLPAALRAERGALAS